MTDSLGRDLPPAAQRPALDALEAAVRARTALVPEIGLVLGSGLGELADSVEVDAVIPFSDLPGWGRATAPGHAGRLVLGRLEGVPVVVQQGRFHVYEGHSPGFVAQPVLLMGRLGARTIVLTNAAGGVNPNFGPATLMAIADHVNLAGRNPLVGPNDDEMGPRFPDMTEVWDSGLRARLLETGRREGIELVEGVYAWLLGPSYETPAEIRMLRALGVDAVGMSTVPEAIAARWAGLAVCGISLVTNAGAGYGAPLSHDEVLAAANEAGPRVARLLAAFVRSIAVSTTRTSRLESRGAETH